MDETSDLTLRAQNKETRIRFGANRRRKNYRMRKARGISPASRTGKCKSAESAKQIFNSGQKLPTIDQQLFELVQKDQKWSKKVRKKRRRKYETENDYSKLWN